VKTVIYTFENFKPVIFEFDRYHFVRDKKALNKLIEKFLSIDAVTTPDELTFPVVLELESGFAPTFRIANKRSLRKQAKNLKKLIGRL